MSEAGPAAPPPKNKPAAARLKPGLHPRNRDLAGYDFTALAAASPGLARYLVTTPAGTHQHRLRQPGGGQGLQPRAADPPLRHRRLGHPRRLPVSADPRPRRLHPPCRRPARHLQPQGDSDRAGSARRRHRCRRQLHLPADRPRRIRLALSRRRHRPAGAGQRATHRRRQSGVRRCHRIAPPAGAGQHLRRHAALGRKLRPQHLQPALPQLAGRCPGCCPAQVEPARQGRRQESRRPAAPQFRRPGHRTVVRGRRTRLPRTDGRAERRHPQALPVVHQPGVEGGKRRPRRSGAQEGSSGRRRGSSRWRRARSRAG